jgi:hypothetical protein
MFRRPLRAVNRQKTRLYAEWGELALGASA